MVDELYQLYLSCFPGIVREEATVKKLLSLPDNHMIEKKEEGHLIGVSVINQNTVLMLCVLPEYRGQGIGSKLLSDSEEYILAHGHSEIQFCDGIDYITPGIPMYEGNVEFFEKRGYHHSWGKTECVDMNLSLADFEPGDYRIGDTIQGIQYRWAVPEDLERITECVEDAWSEFTPYYQDAALYDEKSPQRVLIAVCDDIVCGTLIVSNQTEAKGLGSVGCTTTHPAYQHRGIATTMVRLGTRYLSEIGLPTAYLGYTYTHIIPMYARSGYQVCMKYFMGKRSLSDL